MAKLYNELGQDDYQADWDADTLARAEEIKSDTTRLQRAQEAAKKRLDQKAKELQGLEKVIKSSDTQNKDPSSSKQEQELSKIMNKYGRGKR